MKNSKKVSTAKTTTDVYTEIENARKIMQTKTYEQQNKEFAEFILKMAKKGGKQ